MKKILGAATLAILLPAGPCLADDSFEVTLGAGPSNPDVLACDIFFKGALPSRQKIDSITAGAMQLCRLVDSGHDIIAKATVKDGAPLPDSSHTYAWITFDHKTGQTKGTLVDHEWDGKD